jgi:NAD-dependent dihydropyrimidine dehydrogenase PreA subunit
MFSFLNEQMGFIEALKEIHAANMFIKHASRIEAEIQGVRKDFAIQCRFCFFTCITQFFATMCFMVDSAFTALMTSHLFLFLV